MRLVFKGIEYKASEAFLQALQNYGMWLGREGMRFNGIRIRDRDLITAEQMRAKFYSYDRSLPLLNRVVLLQEWLLQELASLERIGTGSALGTGRDELSRQGAVCGSLRNAA